jgi:hypothetical protein
MKIRYVTWNSAALGGEMGTQAEHVKMEPGEFRGMPGICLYPKNADPAFKPQSEIAQIRFTRPAASESQPNEAPAAENAVPKQPAPTTLIRKRGRPPKAPQ